MRHLLIALLLAAPAASQSLKPEEILSSVAVATVNTPYPVAGADERLHLAFELAVTNPSHAWVTLDRVEVLDPKGRVIASLAGDKLGALITNIGGTGTAIRPGAIATVFLDATVPVSESAPPFVRPRVKITRQSVGPDGGPAPWPPNAPIPANTAFTGAPIKVETRAPVVIDAPLRGGRWVALNGCCDALTSHRGAQMAVNGTLRLPERFAFDWVRLDAQNRLYTGDRATLTNYAFFGAPIYAVADGTVVNVLDGVPEQVPGTPPAGITPPTIGGNIIVIDIGGGAYAFYAHLIPGSLRVRLGEKVWRGQAIAALGSTGNSDGPHLHFHVMDGPSPLNANGIPYVLRSFTGQGQVIDSSLEGVFEKGAPAAIDRDALAGSKTRRLPLNNEVVDFGP